MNISSRKLQTLYPEFLSVVLKEIQSEDKRVEKYLEHLRSVCTLARKQTEEKLSILRSQDLSSSEKKMLSDVDKWHDEGVRFIEESEQEQGSTDASVQLLKKALQSINQERVKMEEVRGVFITRRRQKALEEEKRRKAEKERRRQEALEEEKRRKAEEERRRQEALEEEKRRKAEEERRRQEALEEEKRRKAEEERRRQEALEEEKRRKRAEKKEKERKERVVINLIVLSLLPFSYGLYQYPYCTFVILCLTNAIVFEKFLEKDKISHWDRFFGFTLFGIAATILRQAIILNWTHWTLPLFGIICLIFVVDWGENVAIGICSRYLQRFLVILATLATLSPVIRLVIWITRLFN